ncbi:PEP-CTERM sorting domain-containing protein [Massilia sp. UYP11]|uniref:PEP-CTERM sorting domain-containing protein n=1 Tax=Massilia sp. UYP11 TaxID=1756385 RepID=UPI003D1C0514
MASPLYRVTWLPSDFTAAGLDGAGRVVGTARGGAAVWSPGGATYLGTLLPGSEGLAINAGGAIVGWSGLEDNVSERPVLFSPVDNRMIDLGTLGGVSGRANALNNTGVAVGLSGVGSAGGFDYHAFVYGHDGMLDLNALVDERGDWQLVNALDVNGAGQILAQACNGPGDCRAVRLDLVTAVPEPGSWSMLGAGLALLAWRARRPLSGPWRRIAPALLIALLIAPLAAPPASATLPAASSGSAAINRHGAVTGTAPVTASVTWDALPAPHHLAYVYRDQIMRSLGTLGGKDSSAFDANSYLWQPYSGGVMYGLGALGGFGDGAANGLNNAGSVVGSSSADTPDGPAARAFLYERGAMRDLNALSAMPAGWTLVDATDINDARQTLALACHLEDCRHVRLDPVRRDPPR